MPEVAFTNAAPLEGGPFVTIAGGKDTIAREPRVRIPEPERPRKAEAQGGSHVPGPVETKK